MSIARIEGGHIEEGRIEEGQIEEGRIEEGRIADNSKLQYKGYSNSRLK